MQLKESVVTPVVLVDWTGSIASNQNIPTSTAGDAFSVYSSIALEQSASVKLTSGKLYKVYGYNSSITAQYIQIHNVDSNISNGVVPLAAIQAPAVSMFSYDCTPYGIYLSTGIKITNSSTLATLTKGSANCYFNVLYK